MKRKNLKNKKEKGGMRWDTVVNSTGIVSAEASGCGVENADPIEHCIVHGHCS